MAGELLFFGIQFNRLSGGRLFFAPPEGVYEAD